MSEQLRDVRDYPTCPSCGLIIGGHRDYCYYKQPQEWTPESVKELIGLANIELPAHTLKRIADTHNAALAAAYKKGKQDGVREHYVGK